MKKFLLSFFVILVFALFIINYRARHDITAQALPPETGSAQPAVFSPTRVRTAPLVPRASAGTAGIYKDGTYQGDVADAYYGNVQVQATIQNGKLAAVTFLDYPHDRNTSVSINTQAMPILKTEAIQIQNAQVDIVSGATQTSSAFRESLASALARAHN